MLIWGAGLGSQQGYIEFNIHIQIHFICLKRWETWMRSKPFEQPSWPSAMKTNIQPKSRKRDLLPRKDSLHVCQRRCKTQSAQRDCEAVLLLSPPFEARSELLVSPKRHGQLSVFLGVKQLSLDRRLTFFDRTSVPLSDPA